jgi:N-acetylmuramoyl-L-alanine amidase
MLIRLVMMRSSFKGLRVALLAAFFTVAAAFNPRPFMVNDEGVNIIVIDPGHGGKDPGNLGTGRYKDKEKDVSYDVSVLVKQYIEENLPGTKAILTRKENQFIELYQRTDIANRANADLFISIHCNANDNHSAYGTESFVLGMGEKDQRLNKTAQLENAARLLEDNWESNYDKLDATNPAAIIALRAYQDAFLQQSINIADEIQNQFEGRVKRRNRGVKQQPLAVLRGSTMPAVLVELGFLTNHNEEDFLQSDNGKKLMASAIYRAVKEYKFKRETRDALIQDTDDGSTTSVKDSSASDTHNTEVKEVQEATPNESMSVEKSDTPLFFSVQIAVSRNDLECVPQNFKGVEGIWKEEQYGLFKYYCGKLPSFTETEALRSTILESYPDAYIVAFEKDRKIDLNEAKKKSP